MSVLSERSVCCEDGRASQMRALQAGEIGSVHSWDRTTDVDGPGMRLVLRMSGNPLRCQYCQRPDAWFMRNGSIHTIDATLARIERDAPLLTATGGGFTIAGGDPLLQAEFTAAVLHGARSFGLHTALDTSGHLGRRATDAMLDDTDLVLFDVKSGLPEVYRSVTGRDQAPALEFARRLSARGTPIWARFVVVPGLTDAWNNVAAVASLLGELGTVERVEVVPFDQSAREVWHSLGTEYALELTEEPQSELMDRVREQLRAADLTVV